MTADAGSYPATRADPVNTVRTIAVRRKPNTVLVTRPANTAWR
ncbi:MAG: hypothetical protein WCC65_03790 [Pseudonocardiaceae bacterium]